MSLSKNFFHSYFVFSEYLTSFRRRWNHLILDSSYLRHGWSSFFICRFSSSKNSKNPTWKFGISTSEFSLFPRLHTFSFYVVQIFLKETFWRSKQTFKFWAVKYDPRNGPIIAHILTDIINIRYSPTGRSVFWKTVPKVLSTALDPWLVNDVLTLTWCF